MHPFYFKESVFMKHNARRALSMIMALLMCLSLFTGIVLPASAAETTPAAPPDGTIFVNLGWTESDTPASITVNGKTFALTWGTNAFATAQNGLDAAPAGGTVYLCAGTYGGFNIQKNLTVLGAKYGIDPNVRGKNEQDLWTLNSNRGSGETIITGRINIGVNGGTIYAGANDMTLDGLMVQAAGLFCSNCGSEGSAKITLKNMYLKENTTTPIYLFPYHPTGHTNAYQRDVVIQNFRIEGATSKVMNLSADKADISGVYMHTDCTNTFFDTATASSDSTGEVVWNVHDNMFATPIARVMYINWNGISSNGYNLATGLKDRIKVTTNVYDNVFVNCFVASGSNSNFSLAFSMSSENVYYIFDGNAFYQTKAASSGHSCIAGYS